MQESGEMDFHPASCERSLLVSNLKIGVRSLESQASSGAQMEF